MTGALINLLLPLLFLVSIGFIGYAIILLILSIRKKSRRLWIRAIKISILPIIYIIIIFSLFAWTNKRFYAKLLPEVPGEYVYLSKDSSRFFVMLRADNTFVFNNGQTTGAGFWDIDPSSYQIKFYDGNKKETAHTTWGSSGTKKTLIFIQDGKTIELIKQN